MDREEFIEIKSFLKRNQHNFQHCKEILEKHYGVKGCSYSHDIKFISFYDSEGVFYKFVTKENFYVL